MNPGDKVDYDGRKGIIQFIENDILYVYFHGQGIVKFGRNLRPIGGLNWEKAEAAGLQEAAKNTLKYKSFEKKTSSYAQKSKTSPRGWLH